MAQRQELSPAVIAFVGRQALYEIGAGREWPQDHDGQLADWLKMGNNPNKRSIEYFKKARQLRRVIVLELDRQEQEDSDQ